MNNAVIDIGTNTLILLIAKKKGRKGIHVICDQAKITRLGQGLSENHFFNSEAMERTQKALGEFKEICKKNKVKRIYAVGTAACRTAANAQVFINKIKAEYGFRIDVISGNQEAEYVFDAAWADFGGKGKKLIVVDIGGGSVEIITGSQDGKKVGPETTISLPIGSVRLTEQYVRSDPIQENEFEKLHLAVRNGLHDELDDFYPQGLELSEYTLIATAGTATTLAAINKNLKTYNPKKVHGSILTKEKLLEIVKTLISLPIRERQKLPGMEPLRADVILAGALLLNELMRYFNQDQILVSDRGLRYGVFYKKFIR